MWYVIFIYESVKIVISINTSFVGPLFFLSHFWWSDLLGDREDRVLHVHGEREGGSHEGDPGPKNPGVVSLLLLLWTRRREDGIWSVGPRKGWSRVCVHSTRGKKGSTMSVLERNPIKQDKVSGCFSRKLITRGMMTLIFSGVTKGGKYLLVPKDSI